MGQTEQNAIVITTEDDLDKIDYTRPIVLFSQTTKSTLKFYKMKELIEQRASVHGNIQIEANDTICRQVSNREPQLREFSSSNDIIIFVSGKKSSNGKVLYQVCKEINPNSYFVSEIDDLKAEWFTTAQSVGICGATSTPLWQMQNVAKAIEEKFSALSAS